MNTEHFFAGHLSFPRVSVLRRVLLTCTIRFKGAMAHARTICHSAMNGRCLFGAQDLNIARTHGIATFDRI